MKSQYAHDPTVIYQEDKVSRYDELARLVDNQAFEKAQQYVASQSPREVYRYEAIPEVLRIVKSGGHYLLCLTAYDGMTVECYVSAQVLGAMYGAVCDDIFDRINHDQA